MPSTQLAGFLRRDAWVQKQAPLRARIAQASKLSPRPLDDAALGDVLAFLEALSDPGVARLVEEVPDRVPSQLPVDD